MTMQLHFKAGEICFLRKFASVLQQMFSGSKSIVLTVLVSWGSWVEMQQEAPVGGCSSPRCKLYMLLL